MSAHGLKPVIKSKEDYQKWFKEWRSIQKHMTFEIKSAKQKAKNAQRTGKDYKTAQRELRYAKAMGRKTMTLLEEARNQKTRIEQIKQEIDEQFTQFPITIENTRQIEFHFNKKHLELPEIVPMWVIKCKGKSYYVNHVDCHTSWTTRENPDHPSTKGSIRIQRGNIHIDENGNATITG